MPENVGPPPPTVSYPRLVLDSIIPPPLLFPKSLYKPMREVDPQLVDDDIDVPSGNGNGITREVIESRPVSSSSSAPDVSFRHLGFALH